MRQAIVELMLAYHRNDAPPQKMDLQRKTR
jgi:hypothetical protein